MNRVVFRNAVAADAATVADLLRRTFVATFGDLYDPADLAVFLAGHDEATWRDALLGSADVRLAEVDGVAVGFARIDTQSLPFDPGDRAAAELRQLYVVAERQGTGVAAALIEWAIFAARERGAVDLWLSVFIDNHRARRFYARRGFVEVMPYRFMVGGHADEDIICRLALDTGD